MKAKNKKVAIISTIAILITAIATTLSTIFVKKVDKTSLQLSSEDLRAMSYEELTEEDSKVDNTDYVKFSAFFTRDLDGDGIAEKLKGTCKEVNETDMLYMDLNVLSQGTLKNGKITINGNNFNYSMSMIKDTVLKYNYISDDVTVIELNDVQAGTQKLILGKAVVDIGNDTTNYSKVSSITLTGTHVSEDGLTETEINKTIDLTVDWYGNVSASLYTNSSTYYYDNLSGNTVSFSFNINENERNLLLKDSIATAVIPQLNGYAPTSVVCQDASVVYEYNEETRTLTMTRSSKIDENGVITSSLSRSNTFRVEVTYPQEAFDQITAYTKLTVPVTGKYVAYNNSNEEFENPIESNIATGNLSITFTETPPETGYIYNFDIVFADKKYVSKPSGRYVISKQDLLNLYDNEDYEANFEYTVNWYAKRGNLGEVNSFVMSETKSDSEESYGDKFGQTIMEEYTTNKGIYFTNALASLGEEGTISVYNNDTNELIKTFTKDDFDVYHSTNPYKYSESIKHIRVETSKANAENTLIVHNLKELDSKKIVQDFTKEEIKEVSIIYTYLTGIADIEGTGEETVTDSDYAYYVSETSYANISLETNKISTQETVNEKIYVTTQITQTGDSKWQNGEFLVEVPQEIVNMEINSITTDNTDIKIVAYDLYQKDGKYFIKIITENEVPGTFKITIDTSMSPDPRISTTTKTFKLYAYNEYCNQYYYLTQDTYDVDSDNNFTENVGTATTSLELLSPTSLITLETVSDYNEEDEITIAPNIALVERESRQAKINISLTNNYPNTVSGVKILGKIPFEGNTYIINGNDLKSEFTTTMTANGINNSDSNPEGVREKTVVYYSENENATQDLTDPANDWMLLEDVQDFSKIKTYLIDLKDNEIEVGKEIKFDYDINLPENISYNLASFSTHAVYYDLNTEGGNINLSTEPNKVGVRIVNKFDLELIKYKVNSNLTISGVTYALKYKEPNPEGELEDKTRILTTNDEGKVILEDLLAETDYVLQEIKVPNTCELSTEEISFKINEDLSVTFNGTVRNYEFTTGEVLKIEVEDEVKYNININKTKIGTSVPISNVRFLLVDEDGNKTSVRTQNGTCTLEGLSLNKVYTLSEAVVPGNCELNEGVFKFKLVRNNNVIELVTVQNSLVSGTPTITDLENEITPVLKLNIQNEIKYSLNLNKQDLEGNKIGGAVFTIKGKGFSSEGTKYTTSKDGKISISGLYVGENYIVEETSAVGYYLDSSKDNTIQFRIDRSGGSLQITTWTVGDGILQSGTQLISEQDLIAEVSVTLQNEKVPTYNLKIVKQNDEGEILPGAQFKLTSVDTGAEEIITIDENGEGIFEGLYEFIDGKCVIGEYTLQEIYAPQGYVINENILKFVGSRNTEGVVEISLVEGSKLIKLDETTNAPLITYTENDATFTIMNEPVFSLKKYGDNNSLLPNAKFIVTDLDGNQVTDVNGQVVGVEETINGVTYTVVTTNENGEITVDLPEGLYKVVEIAAPEGYVLPENEEDRTYYFGIGASRPVQTSGVIDTVQWAKSVKSKAVSQFNDGVATDDGGTIAVGRSKVNIDIDGDGIADGIDKGNMDAIIVKYDTNGNIEWSKILGGINDDELYGIAKVPTGGYVLVGYSSTSDVYYGDTLIDVANYGNEDGIIVKIDENGNYLWSQSIGGTGTDRINDVVVSQTGDIAVVGSYYSSSLYMDKDKTEALTNLGNKDGFISVYTDNGTYRWSQNIGGTSDVYGQSVAATSTGFAVGANFLGTVYVDTAKTASVASKGNADGILIGYTTEGTYSFSKQIGSTANDTISEIILADDNETEGQKDIIVVGSYAGSIDIDADGTNDLTTKGNNDGMIVKFSEAGDYIKCLSMGGTNDDTIRTVIQTEDGGLLFGGWTYSSTVDLDKDGTNDITSLSGISDGLIAKLSAADELEWFDSIKGASYDKVTKVIQTVDGNLIAVGDYQSASLTVMKNAGVLTCSKFADAFIIKYAETETTSEIPEMQRISVSNELVKYKITTEIAPNGDGERTGGSITGAYSDAYPEENNIQLVELVKYGYDNSKDIVITPWTNYDITRVTINGEELTLEPDENGVITLSAGYFENMQEDKHIVVSFVNRNHSLVIEKQDKDGNKLSGATFEITTNNDTPEFGELQGNGATYTEADTTKELTIEGTLTENGTTYVSPIKENEVTGVLGALTDNGTYVFTESDGTYIPNNTGVANSVANSYMTIDLSGLTGYYTVVVNAQVSSQANQDYGYATITEGTTTTTAPTYSNTTGQFIKIAGTTTTVTTAKDYNSAALEGGKTYLLHLGYRKNGSTNTGNDIFTVNSVNVYEAQLDTYYFEEQDGVYTPNNTAVSGTDANSYIPIDLTGKTGKYAIVVNAETTGNSTSYLYAALTTTTTAPAYSSSSKIMYISGTQTAKDYTTIFDGDKLYYLHLGYRNTSTTNTPKINSIKLYETKEVTYGFTESDGTYTSSNQTKDNTVANSYIPLDLSKFGGEYTLKINAQISSQSSDYGYVNITNGTTAPAYSSAVGQLIKISGTVSAKDYTTVLEGGTTYYIHLGYYKNASTSSGNDTFTINSISVTPVVKTYTVTTDEEGKAVTELDYSKYTIKETVAPENYILSEEIIETELTASESSKTIVVENQKMPQIIVHHYLKDGDTYTTTQVADDEITVGTPGESYETSPKMDLENYILEKDENGEYVIPTNATGTYTDSDQEIIYYYEEKPVILTVHHYLEGTEDSIADDVIESLKKESTYKTVASEDALKDYELVSVDGIEEDTITEDTVVIYYYKIKVHQITTKVQKHTEQRTDSITNQKAEVEVLGGTISGEYTEIYKEENEIKFVEEVKQKENSITQIIVTPDDAYIVKTITLTSTSDESVETQTVIFGEGAVQDAEISYTQNADGSITLDVFESVTEDKHIVVEFEPVVGEVITHHIIKGEDTDYATTNKTDLVGEPYQTGKIDIEHYKLVETSNNVTGTYAKDVTHVYYYYDKENYNYSVHYFYDGIENKDKTITLLAEWQSNVTTYEDKVIDGYKLEKVEPVNGEGNLGLTITDNADNNIINVYYIKDTFAYTIEHYYEDITTHEYILDESATAKDSATYQDVIEITEADKKLKTGYEYERAENAPLTISHVVENNIIKLYYGLADFSYSIHYFYDDVEDASLLENVDGAEFGSKIATYTDKIKDGYKFEKVVYGNSEDNQELTITENADNNIINVYYIKDTYGYTIEHYYEDITTHKYILDESATAENSATYQDIIEITEADKKLKTGYEYERAENAPLTISHVVENNIIKLYYGLADFSYSIHYFYDGVEDSSLLENVDGAEFGSKIATYTNKIKDGYKFEKVVYGNSEDNQELTITENADNNIINVYYIKDTYGYTIEHYYEDITTHEYILDESATAENSATYQDVIEITEADKKLKTGYQYERAENAPLTISHVVENNIIKLYYGLADFSYSVHYFYDGVEDETKVEDDEKAEFASKVTTYTDKVIDGYKLEKVEPVNGEGNLELTITENADNNIINVYYIKDTYGYTIEHYYEDITTHEYILDESATAENSATYQDVIEITEADKKLKTGYEYERAENAPLTISHVVENNIIKLYYGLADFSYSVHYFYEGIEDVSKVETIEEAEFASKITTYTDKNITGYQVDRAEPVNSEGNLELTITDDPSKNIINVYYVKKDYEYTVHYFYDGVEDTSETESHTAKFESKITTYTDKAKGYRLETVIYGNSEDNKELTITDNTENNVIKVYYRTNYTITTDVIEHTETYKDGTVIEDVTGGKIVIGNGQSSYENVFKGDSNKKAIKIIPSKIEAENEEDPDIEYKIVKIVIKDGKQDKNGTELDLSNIIDEDGSVTLEEGYFTNMESDKHIEVEFRRKTNVIIKHLEEETETVLYTEEGKDYEEIIGYESESFETARRVIANYQASDLGITDENKVQVSATVTMFADTTTIIYWYERIPSGITVKHIEINEKDIENGLTLQSGEVLEEETFTGKAGLTETTERKSYENYISVNGPDSNNSNIIIAKGTENSKTVTYSSNNVLEVRYYYEKQYFITAQVKKHEETIVNPETGETETINVAGGTIEIGNNLLEEVVLSRGNSENEIVITPDSGYKVKFVTVYNKTLDIKDLEDENHKVVLPKAYFSDVQENKNIVVEFEKIPAKVIVEYRDKDTNEKIIVNKVIEGFVNDGYNESRIDIENYIPAEPEPENTSGPMTEEPITITYWYTRQFKLTTDIIEHEGMDKGGKITGEDKNPYELVTRGNSNTLGIEIEPFSGYKIKEILINGNTLDYINDENIVKEGNIVKIPGGYFINMQENKEIVVEFEKIPALVKVQYLEEGTDKVLYTSEDGKDYEALKGYVNDEYTSSPKDIKYYELREELYPENHEGTMTEEEITVKYYYRKLLFNMKIEKDLDKILMNGQEQAEWFVNSKLAKLEIDYKDMEQTKLEISYKIKVTNTEEIEGSAIVEEIIPEGFDFVPELSDSNWKEQYGVYVIETGEMATGETKEYIITLRWRPEEGNKGSKQNIAKITQTSNLPGFGEITLEDNEDKATVEIKVNKTIQEIIDGAMDDIKDGNIGGAITGVIEDVTTSVKTGDAIIISVATFMIAGVVILIITKKSKTVKTSNIKNIIKGKHSK